MQRLKMHYQPLQATHGKVVGRQGNIAVWKMKAVDQRVGGRGRGGPDKGRGNTGVKTSAERQMRAGAAVDVEIAGLNAKVKQAGYSTTTQMNHFRMAQDLCESRSFPSRPIYPVREFFLLHY